MSAADRVQTCLTTIFLTRRVARSVRRFAVATILVALMLASASLANAVQSIRITKINGVDVPPDEVFVPNPPNDFFDIEWEAVDTDCNHGVNNMVTNVDSTPQTSSGGSGFSGFVTLDQGAFPLGCRHSIQIVANFRRPGSCLVLTTSVTSAPQAFWSSPYKDCIGPPKSCQDGAGRVGQPCDVATGKMYHEMTDLTIQGPLPIKFVRRYDSQSTANGSLGYGWRHSYAMRIGGGGTNREIFTDAQGRQVYFNLLSSGVWDDNRIEHLSLAQGSPPWRVTDKQKTLYDFDGSGNLTTITDRNGNTLTFGYTGSDLTSITDGFGRQATLVYSGGHLQTLTAGSRTVTYHYDPDSNLTRVDFQDSSVPDSSFVTYEYLDPNEPAPKHNLTAAKDPLGHVIEAHTYYGPSDGADNDKVRTTQSDAGNHLYSLVYDSSTQTTVTNSLAHQTVYTLDNFSGLVTQSTGPGCTSCGGGGTTTTIAYYNNLEVKDVTDGRGVLTHLTYDDQGNVLTRTEGSGARTWTYAYEGHGFVTAATVPSVGTGACLVANPNRVVTNTYDGAGNLCNQRVSGCNGATSFCYETFYEDDSHGQIKKQYNPRDCVGLASCTIPAVPPPVTVYDYFADGDADLKKRGRLQRITNALGHQTNYASHDGGRAPYDLFGNVRSVIDSNDVETQYEYDGKDRVTSVTLPADVITTENQYDVVGNLHQVRLPNCVEKGLGMCPFTFEYVYDTVNRVKEVHDAVGNKIVYTYDTEGNRTREEYQNAGAVAQRYTNFVYDTFNRLQHVCHDATTPGVCGPIFTEYTYYDDGARHTEQDPLGHVTTFDYDALKRLSTVTQTVGVSTLTTTYGYDGQDNLASVRAPNSTGPGSFETTYTNSDMGWRLSTISPDTGTTTYGYDPAGNLTTTTNAIPVTVSRSYDFLNRLTGVTYPGVNNPLNVTYTYDTAESPTFFNVGRRTGMTDPSGSSVFHYNRRGLLKKEDKAIGSRTYTTQYDYDKTGNLTQILYPTESQLLRQGEVDYEYDDANRVFRVRASVNGTLTTVADTFTYKPFGPRTGMRFGNLLSDTRSYGTRYQLGTWTLGSLLSYTHTFNDDLNLIGRTDNLNAGNNRTFGYDEVHRLKSSSGPWCVPPNCTSCTGSVTYTYDLNGNRQCKGETASVTNYAHTPSTNRLASSTGGEVATYSSDNNGNITGDGTHTYQYSQADRLATVDSGATATYMYDGDGRRVAKASGSLTTNYLYDPNGRLLSEVVPGTIGPGGNTTTGKDYLYLQGDPLARVDWTVMEANLTGSPGPLLVSKASPNVHLDWTNATGSGSYVVRRKQVVNPADKTFNGSIVIAGVADPARFFNDPVLNDANRYDYRVFRRTSSDALLFYHTDHLGTPIAMTDGIPTIVWRAEYRPFGDGTPTGSAVSNLRFPGQYFDLETSLHQNWFRDYESRSGRYVQPDPLGATDAEVFGARGVRTNRLRTAFLYAQDNPITEMDPAGLMSRVCCKRIPYVGLFGFRHCYVETVTNKGRTSCGLVGGVFSGEPYGTGHIYRDNGFDTGGDCGPWNPSCKSDQCVVDTAQSYPNPSNYSFANGPNSNTFAGTIARKCGLGQPGVVGARTPGWNDPPAGPKTGSPEPVDCRLP